MRVSKPPEERRQEIIDTAMKLFSIHGYEKISITDIAREMNVVSGLCYRYFSSKEEIYQTALDQYAYECASPYIQIMDGDFESMKDYKEKLSELFLCTDGQEKYHSFFHKTGNQIFHNQLEISMLDKIKPHMISMITRMNEHGLIHLKDPRSAAMILLYGQMPIINDEQLKTDEKINVLYDFFGKMLNIEL